VITGDRVGLRPLLERFDRTATAFARLARSVRDDEAWDDGLRRCAFASRRTPLTYWGVLAQILV